MRYKLDIGDLPEAKPRSVNVGGREIVVVCWRGHHYALRNICPHMSCALAGGRVRARMYGHEVGEMDADDETPVIECPWHNFAYDLQTGQCYADRTLRVRTYQVVEEPNGIYVDLPAGGAAGARGLEATEA